MPTLARLRFFPFLSIGLLPIFLSSCSSDSESGRHSSVQRHRKPPSPMAGQGTFFDGNIVAALSVRSVDELANLPDAPGDDKTSNSDSRGHSQHGGGMGGGGMGGGGMGGGGGGHRHGGSSNAPTGDSTSDSSASQPGVRPIRGNMGPPMLIHLRLTNQSSERVQLRIVDFTSPLGNFDVQPEVLMLDPSQSLETEPMGTQLAESLAETSATLVLLLGGKSDKQTIVLHALTPAAKDGGPAVAPGDPSAPAKATTETPGK